MYTAKTRCFLITHYKNNLLMEQGVVQHRPIVEFYIAITFPDDLNTRYIMKPVRLTITLPHLIGQ